MLRPTLGIQGQVAATGLPANTVGADVITMPRAAAVTAASAHGVARPDLRPATVASVVPPTSGRPMMNDSAIAGSIMRGPWDPIYP